MKTGTTPTEFNSTITNNETGEVTEVIATTFADGSFILDEISE